MCTYLQDESDSVKIRTKSEINVEVATKFVATCYEHFLLTMILCSLNGTIVCNYQIAYECALDMCNPCYKYKSREHLEEFSFYLAFLRVLRATRVASGAGGGAGVPFHRGARCYFTVLRFVVPSVMMNYIQRLLFQRLRSFQRQN